jgi:hypothetical protein
MVAKILLKKGTIAQLNAAAALNQLNEKEPYYITDEQRLAVGITVNSYSKSLVSSDLNKYEFTEETLTINTAVYGSYSGTIFLAGVTSNSYIDVKLAPNNDFEADDLDEYGVLAQPLTNAFMLFIKSNGPIVGTFKVLHRKI